MDTADWGARFEKLAVDAGQTYVRTLRRYNELLDRVARRELTPEAVQQQFAAYLQEQSSASTRELVELSVGLLAGLLHLEARYRDQLLDGLLPAVDPAPPPPTPASLDLTNWFQALAAYASEQSSRSIGRHQQLVEKVAAGTITPQQMKEQGERFLERHAPALLGDVMALGLTFVARLQQSSTLLADGFYDRVLGQAEAEHHVEPPICVELRATSGATASACIVVENTRPGAADVVCQVSDFAPRRGGERFDAAVSIEPARFSLPPGAHRDVDIRLRLDPVRFAVETDYVATLLIAGAERRDLVVQLIARADTAVAESPSRSELSAAINVAAESAPDPR